MKAALITYKNSLNNKIFDTNKRDNTSRKFIYLKKNLRKYNIFLDTYDINRPEESVFSIHFDVHKNFIPSDKSKKNILIVRESPIINKLNNKAKVYNKFDLVLTWNKELCDQKNIFWIGYGCSAEIKENDLQKIYDKKQREICSIISKKYRSGSNSLYKERVKALKFFNKTDFGVDLYGYGWEKRQFSGILRPFNRIKFAKTFLYKPPVFYKGFAKSKSNIFNNYKFSLCFENCKSSGYITEKIFDSMFSFCIPIYNGCPYISKDIDPNTFIDTRDFKSYKELYKYLKGISKDEYFNKMVKIIDFYKSFTQTTYYDHKWAEFITYKCLSIIK